MSKIEKYNHILTGFGSNILGNLLMFGTTIFLTRVFDPEVYGEFRFIFSFIALVVIILLLGRDNGIIYFTQNEELNKDKIITEEIYFSFIVLLAGTFILYLLSDFILSIFFNKNTTLKHFQLSLFMIPLWGLFNLMLAALKSKGLINYTFILSNLTQRALRIPFFLVLVLFSTNYYSLAFGMILSQLVLIYLAIKKLLPFHMLKDVELKDFFTRFSYSIQLGFNAIIVVLLTKIDVIMVGKYTDNSQVAIYDTCVLLSFVIMLPFVALVKSSEPVMKALIHEKDVQEKYIKNLKLAIELSLGVLLFFLIAPKEILYIFGEIYASGSDALVILSISYMILVILGAPIEVLNMNGYTKISSVVLMLSIFLNIGLNSFLIPMYGIIGASISTGISLIFSKIIGLFLVQKKLNMTFIHQIINFKIYLLFGFFLYIGTFIENKITFLISIAIYLCYLFALVILNKKYRTIVFEKFYR